MTPQQSADVAFRLLSDEIRIDILRAIAEAQREKAVAGIESGETGLLVTPLSFSEIYRRVDVDSTSKLSYHLGELTETFLQKGEGGYVLTHAGEQMIRFILAENYLQPADFGPLEAAGSCLYCGGPALEATLHDQYFLVRCTVCDQPAAGYVTTPAQTRAHDGRELLDSLKRKQATDYLLTRQGICPSCTGRMETTVHEVPLEDVPFPTDRTFIIVDECGECLRIYSTLLIYAAFYHPASIAFHWDRGVDVTGTGVWELHQFVQDGQWTVSRRATDPEEYEVVLRWEDATLRVVLNETGTVIRTERVRDHTVD
jgi:DNA-binding transcriptional ArsR family regulator